MITTSTFNLLFAMAMADAHLTNVSNLNEMLPKLDKNKSNSITIDLTKSNLRVHFVKVLNKWGAMADNGDWSPLENIDPCTLDQMVNIVRDVLKQE